MAIDYAADKLVVLARCHGNNVENFWEGNSIAAAPGAAGYQNQFTGTNGNIHISWLGKLSLASGTLSASTYVAEFAEGTGSLGTPSTDPALDGWPNPNGGWLNVNSTRCSTLRVTADGSVCVTCVGRRTMTTANAYQKMPKPGTGSVSAWNSFARVYAPDLGKPLYSSLLAGAFDTLTGVGGDNTVLHGLYKTDSAILITGYQKSNASNVAVGVPVPLTGVPAWGASVPAGQSALFARLGAAALVDTADNAVADTVGSTPTALPTAAHMQDLLLFPNPANTSLEVRLAGAPASSYTARVFDATGRPVYVQRGALLTGRAVLNVRTVAPGIYTIAVQTAAGTARGRFVVLR